MPDPPTPRPPEDDDVGEASEESFPASDAPGWTGSTSTVRRPHPEGEETTEDADRNEEDR